MISEWMQVMLEEISRKKLEAQAAQIERERRTPAPATTKPGASKPVGGGKSQ